MTRKAGRVPEETRACLLKAATDEFCRVGFSKTSLRTVCTRAGVTTGAVYFFFDGKDDLLAQIIEPVCTDILAFIDQHYGIHARENCAGLYASNDEDIAAARELVAIIRSHEPAFTVLVRNQEHEAVVSFLNKVTEQLTAYLSGCDEAVAKCYPNALGSGGETAEVWLAHVIVDSFLEAASESIDSASCPEGADSPDAGKCSLEFIQGTIIVELRVAIQMVLRYRMLMSGQADIPKEVLPLPAD